MRDLKIIQAAPDDNFYFWQTHLWLESLRLIGKSDKAVSLIFTPKDRPERNPKWDELIERYPEAEFFFQKDEDNITNLLPIYIPILRPYVLSKYFELHPELKDYAIFYCDADILFLENFNIDSFLNDDICYLSDTNSYINAEYFDSKAHQVLPNKIEDFKKIDVLNTACSIVGISRDTAVRNNLNSGGAQYILKNIDAAFWKKVLSNCLQIKAYLKSVNNNFFESENAGYQSWTSDMWAVLWNLWAANHETKVIKELDFAWSTDKIDRLKEVSIFHNAGISSQLHTGHPVFYKGIYINHRSPFNDPYVKKVHEDEKTKTLCNWFYVDFLLKTQNKYKLK